MPFVGRNNPPPDTLYGAQTDPDPFRAGPVHKVTSLHAPRPGPNRFAPQKGASAPPTTGGPARQPMQQLPHQPAQGPQHPPVALPQSSSLNPAGIRAKPAGVTPLSLGVNPRPSRTAGFAAGVTQHPGMQGQGGQHPGVQGQGGQHPGVQGQGGQQPGMQGQGEQHPEEIPDWEVGDDDVLGLAPPRQKMRRIARPTHPENMDSLERTQAALAAHEDFVYGEGWDEDEDEEGEGHWPEDEDDQNPTHYDYDPDYYHREDDDPNVHYGIAI
ncbi:hypothetical protein Z517_02323 [Fonsecaea pedrosoi CBS 271.37]|uniref:Uncharacterized protein n=1 Tax=Fonsecaea pedrosoi CBS 271.37 TaxID=1442368 RepID=A0A0D2GWU5_9EURO|nr:uncharacterized protein Z517_02323 [Fonsecaea pedrosoi CBS 271.37]KIW83080.1 hypothetical protein Z517_02323 [Fonsecaea pedrosoi CBS 271.37]